MFVHLAGHLGAQQSWLPSNSLHFEEQNPSAASFWHSTGQMEGGIGVLLVVVVVVLLVFVVVVLLVVVVVVLLVVIGVVVGVS